eukprot:scaffold153_cov347-Pavlova_lutheri.AAC.53
MCGDLGCVHLVPDPQCMKALEQTWVRPLLSIAVGRSLLGERRTSSRTKYVLLFKAFRAKKKFAIHNYEGPALASKSDNYETTRGEDYHNVDHPSEHLGYGQSNQRREARTNGSQNYCSLECASAQVSND